MKSENLVRSSLLLSLKFRKKIFSKNKMKDNFYILDEHEVISVHQSCQPILKNPTCTSQEFLLGLQNALKELARFTNSSGVNFDPARTPDWFKSDGIAGEALRFGEQGWQTGQIKLALVFCPDELEEETEDVTSGEVPLLEASLEPIETSSKPLDELRKLADET